MGGVYKKIGRHGCLAGIRSTKLMVRELFTLPPSCTCLEITVVCVAVTSCEQADSSSYHIVVSNKEWKSELRRKLAFEALPCHMQLINIPRRNACPPGVVAQGPELLHIPGQGPAGNQTEPEACPAVQVGPRSARNKRKAKECRLRVVDLVLVGE